MTKRWVGQINRRPMGLPAQPGFLKLRRQATLPRYLAPLSYVARDGVTLWFACRHPAPPMLAKCLCMFVVAYALSPIDLVPDLGYVDDILLLPGLIWLAVRLIPVRVLAARRVKAGQWLEEQQQKPTSYWGVALVVCIWVAVAYGVWCALR